MPKLRVIIKPPPEPQGDAEQQTEALRDYLLQVSEELAYVLTHLEADNINDSTFERISEMIPKASVTAPPMDGAGSAGGSSTWARGDHQHPTDTSRASDADLTAHTGNTSNPHSVTKTQVGLSNVANERQYSAQNPPPTPSAADVGAIPTTAKGTAGGVAELDANGMVPSAQLPSYVDDVLEYASLSAFPVTGETGKIYVALDTNKTYRWSGSAYVEISESLALGETSGTAYQGDRGKAAYDHSQVTSGNPHNVTAAEVGLGNVANERQYSAQNPPPLPTPADIGAATAQDLTDHVGDTNNPHSVTAAQVGLGNVDNVQQYSASNPPPAPDAEDVPYDNTGSGLMATDVQAAIDEIAQGGGGGGTAASAVSYDPTGSGLAATNVQDAIDEVYGDIPSQASDIGAQAEITASGILKGDGQGGVSAAVAGTDYQAPLTIDATPTASSTNPVQSGGVYADVRTRVPVYGRGRNLLDNAYFVGGGSQLGFGTMPINQRGQTSYSGAGYGLDRYNQSADCTTTINAGYVTLSFASASKYGLWQKFPVALPNGVYTASVLTTEGLYTKTGTLTGSNEITGNMMANISVRFRNGQILIFSAAANTSVSVIAMSLEPGPESTLCHNEGTDANPVWVLNTLPDYQQELAKCQQYYLPLPSYERIRAALVGSNIQFFVPTPVTMRTLGNTSGVKGSPVVETINGVAQSGFAFYASDTLPNGVRITATKSGHGLSDAIFNGNGAAFSSEP